MKDRFDYKRIARLALGTATIALASYQPAWADQAAEQAPAAQSSGVGDIVVTAQRRSQSVKDVPISVQVLTSEMLERRAIIDTRDITRLAPTLTFTNSASALINTFALRGIATTAQSPGLQPSTAMVLDGVPLYNQGEFIAGLGDVQRIEILNGPQGTLFGKNSTAGVINIVTQQPVDHHEGMLEASYTNDEELYVRAMFNAPIGDGARLRINQFYRDQQPLVTNLSGLGDGAAQRVWGVNAKLALDLTSDMTFTLSGTHSENRNSYGQFVIVGASTLASTPVGLTVPVGPENTTVNVNAPSRDVFRNSSLTGTLEWDVSDTLTITSISNYTHFKDANYLDEDGTLAGSIVGRGFTLPGSTYPLQSLSQGFNARRYRLEYYTEELRANYQFAALDAVFGAFYQHVSFLSLQNTPILFSGSFSTQLLNATVDNDTASVFGDLTYRLSDTFKVFGGLRYTRETLDVDYNRVNYGATASLNVVTGELTGAPASIVSRDSDRTVHNLSGRVGVQYQPTSDLNFYASFARGYKGSAANTTTGVLPGQDLTLLPELATAYEIGAKLRLFDNAVALNGAVYYEEIENQQTTALDPTKVVITSLLINAGYVSSTGFEGDLIWAVTPEFRLTGALAYNEALYHGFAMACNSVQNATGTCPNYNGQIGAQNAEGLRVAKAPEWKYSIGASYENNFTNSDYSFYGDVNWTWYDEFFNAADNTPNSASPAHGSLDVSVGMRSPGDHWEVQLFGKNLTDDFYYGSLVTANVIGRPVGYLARDTKAYGGIRLLSRF